MFYLPLIDPLIKLNPNRCQIWQTNGSFMHIIILWKYSWIFQFGCWMENKWCPYYTIPWVLNNTLLEDAEQTNNLFLSAFSKIWGDDLVWLRSLFFSDGWEQTTHHYKLWFISKDVFSPMRIQTPLNRVRKRCPRNLLRSKGVSPGPDISNL